MNTEIIGFFGCGMLFISFIPQTLHIIKSNDRLKQVSNHFLFLIIFTSIIMGYYGHLIQRYPVLIANSSVLINNLFILYKKMMIKKLDNINEKIEKSILPNI